jgi:uncharacterized protein YndB with AHSA1/START domain
MKEINLEVTIDNSIENVWRAITESEFIKQYMYNSSVESDWRADSAIFFYVEEQGARTDMVYGKIEKIDPPRRLKHTLYPPGAPYPNVPANHIHVDYQLREKEGKTELRITQDGYDTAADGEKRYQHSVEGWKTILPQLKEVAENVGKGE